MAGASEYDAGPSIQEEGLWRGRLFVGSTTELSPGTGDGIQVTLDNPSTSGVDLHVTRLVATSSTGPVYPHLFKNPDTGLPSTTRDIMDANAESGNDSSGTLKADAGSTDLSGGTDTGIEFGVETGVTHIEHIDVLIPPTGTLGLNVPTGGTLTGESACFNVWFMEEPR